MTAVGVAASRCRAAARARLHDLRTRHGWLDHLARAGTRYVEQRGNHFAAAVTFFSVLTAVPLLMVAFAAAGYVLWFDPALLVRLERAIAEVVPGGLSEALDPVLQAAIAQRNTVAGVGLAAALWSGVWWMSNLREAVSAQWGLPAPHPAAVARLLHDLVALVGLGAVLAGSLAVTALGSGLTTTALDLLGAAHDGFNQVVLRASAALVGLVANWLVLLWAITRLPRTDVPTRGATRAAFLGAVAFELLKQGTALYLGRVTTSASGAVFGSLLGLLLFSYVVARLVLFVTAWAATAPDRRSRPPRARDGGPTPGTVDAMVASGRGGGAVPGTAAVGPVEWVALTFPGEVLDADVARPLGDLVTAGAVRVLDAVVVHKAPDGAVREGELEDEGAGAFDGVDGDVLELLSHDDLLGIAERLEPGTTTLVVVWENRWATELAEAVRRRGGRLLAHDRVRPEDVERALRAVAVGSVGGAPA